MGAIKEYGRNLAGNIFRCILLCEKKLIYTFIGSDGSGLM